jgi:hypothetical protein
MVEGCDTATRKMRTFFCDNLSNSDLNVRRDSEGRQLTRLKTISGDDMPQYMAAIHMYIHEVASITCLSRALHQ